MLNQMSWNGGALNMFATMTELSSQSTVFAVAQTLQSSSWWNATGRKWSIAWRLAGEQKGSVFATASYKHIVFLYLIGPYPCNVHPFSATPTQAQASVPEVALGELQVDLDEISESENRFLLRERVFFRMRLWTTQIDALSTLIGKWHFHQTVDMFEGY